MFVPTFLFFQDLLNHGTGEDTTAFLGSASICLTSAPVTPTIDTTFADLTEANYGGYVRVAGTPWTLPAIDLAGNVYVNAAAATFRPTNSTTPNTIYGAFLMGDASTKLYGVEVFDTPIPLPTPSEQLTYIPRVSCDPNGQWGNGTVST